jgi:anti-sigma factor RsiW
VLPDERAVAGLRCSEVLDRLSDFLDGDLPPEDESRVRAHVAACDVCARFGGELAALVATLRAARDRDVEPGVAARLDARLAGTRR